MARDSLDPSGIIGESFRIEAITAGECRSIFLDWTLKHSLETDMMAAVQALLARHANEPQDHPMILTLKAALDPAATPSRKGGRAARVMPN